MNATAAAFPVLEVNEHRARLALMTISRATDLWLDELENRRTYSETTVNTYRRLLDKLAAGKDDLDVRDLTISHVRRFLDRESRKRNGKRKAPGSIAQNVSIINEFFDWLDSEGLLTRNPTRRNNQRIFIRPRQIAPEDNDNVTTVSTEDVRRLLVAANQMGWSERLAVNCLVYLGPRRRAAARLRLRDYDQVECRLTFAEKGNKTIAKPVPDDLVRLLDEAIASGLYSSPDDYLIPSPDPQRRKGERDDRVIYHLVKKVASKAGVVAHVHSLRAAFAVHYLEQNPGDILALQQLMGHRRIDTTTVYLRKLNRQKAMETVRSLSWDDPRKEPNSEESLEAKPLAEKEGFEPSKNANPLRDRDGSQGGGRAP